MPPTGCFWLGDEVDDETVAVVGETGPFGDGDRGSVGAPCAVLDNRLAAEPWAGCCAHHRRGQAPVARLWMSEHADRRHLPPHAQAGHREQGVILEVAERRQAVRPAFVPLRARRLLVQAGDRKSTRTNSSL